MGFEHENSTRFHSNIGAFFSFLTLVPTIAITILFGQEIYKRKHPSIADRTVYLDYSKVFMKDYPLLFSFHYGDGEEISNVETLFKLKIEKNTFSEKGNLLKFKNYTMTECSNLSYRNNADIVQQMIASTPYKLYCINFSDYSFFQNELATPNSTYYRLLVKLCNPNKHKYCTYDKDKIRKRTVGTAVMFFDNILDSSNHELPVKPYVNKVWYPFSEGLLKFVNWKVLSSEYISDDGWMLESNRVINYYKTDNFRVDNTLVDPELENMVFTLLLEAPKLIIKTNRNYLKVQELFARIGGIVNAFIIIMSIMTHHLMRFKYMEFINNNSFNEMDSKLIEDNKKSHSFEAREKIILSRLYREDQEIGIANNSINIFNQRNSISNNRLSNNIVENRNQGINNNLLNLNIRENEHVIYGSNEIQNKDFDNNSRNNSNKNIINSNLNNTLARTKHNKFEISHLLFGREKKESDSNDSNERYTYVEYLKYSLSCCVSEESKRKYDIFKSRIEKFMDISLFKYFLIESYALHFQKKKKTFREY